MSLKLSDRWRLGLEGVWMEWSAAASTMPFKMTNGDNPNVNILVNGSPTAATFTYPFPLNWDDSFTGKAGLEFKATKGTTLRAGYLYGNSPVPDSSSAPRRPTIGHGTLRAANGRRRDVAQAQRPLAPGH